MPKTRTLFDNVRADVRPQFNTFLTLDPRFLHIATTFEFPFIFRTRQHYIGMFPIYIPRFVHVNRSTFDDPNLK